MLKKKTFNRRSPSPKIKTKNKEHDGMTPKSLTWNLELLVLVIMLLQMRRIVRKPALQNSVDANERDVCGKTTTFDDVRVPASDFKTRLDDMRPLNCCSGNEFKTTSQDGDCCSNALLDLSTNGGILGKPENKEHNSFSFFF